MNIHKNARLTPLRREEMAVAVLGGALTKAQAARVYAVSPKIVSRWVKRFKQDGRAAMADRSSRPKHSPRQTDMVLSERIAALRRQRLTGKHIAMETGVSPATVSRVLKRAGLSRMKDIAPAEPVVRYEYAEHIRTKPYTPKTNGKAERFIQTALREWAYARAYPSSDQRKAYLPKWNHMYNWHRPHGSLKSKTPISRLGMNQDNLLTLHI